MCIAPFAWEQLAHRALLGRPLAITLGKQPPPRLPVAHTTPEPAWHRRLRQQRSNAKQLLRAVRSTELFYNHHGSGMGDAKARASSSARTRADEATAWLCRFCKKPNGDSLINRKDNKQCHACKKLKSQCFKAKFDVDKHGSRSPTTSRNDRRPTPTREQRDQTTRKLEGMLNKLTEQIAQCLPTRLSLIHI